MRREMSADLLIWKDRPDRKPLILKGVRQCGKTYLLRQFGAEHFPDVAYFNFEGNEALQERFNGDLDARRILTELGVLRGKAFIPGKTLVIFDEIQFCNRALSALKYFCEEAPEYHIACAGSLLGVAMSQPLSFPVGKVDLLTLRPLSFHEFLMAADEDLLLDHLESLRANERVSDLLTSKLEQHLRTFFITGGMPEAVASWFAQHDIERLEEILQRILDSYELDFAKHAPSKDFPKLAAIWRSVPVQLARENSKFIFGQVSKGSRARDLEDALEWLLSTGLIYKVAKVEKPFFPLSAYADPSCFKLYMADIGLLRRLARLPAAIILENNEAFKEFKGALCENYVLCELINLYHDSPYYWRSGNAAEVDFVIQQNQDIVPIEVKSGHNERARSLSEYRKKYTPRVSVITSQNNVSGNEVKNVPLYLLWKLQSILQSPVV